MEHPHRSEEGAVGDQGLVPFHSKTILLALLPGLFGGGRPDFRRDEKERLHPAGIDVRLAPILNGGDLPRLERERANLDGPCTLGRPLRSPHECVNTKTDFGSSTQLSAMGPYVQIDNETLRRQVEQVLIKFLKSNAVINKQSVDRD